MTRSYERRTPKKKGGFSWGRLPTSDGSVVTWRLFRRDHTGALHVESRSFFSNEDRQLIAERLRRARHELRDRVDEIDLRAMGIAA